VLSFIAAVIGCFGAQRRNKCGRIMLILYVLCIISALVLSVGSIFQTFADGRNVYNYALRQWRSMTATEERIVELELLCCNFIHMLPCCRFEPSALNFCINNQVCFETVEQHLLDNFEIIKITSMIQMVWLSAVLLFSLGFCIYLQQKDKANEILEKVKQSEDDHDEIEDDEDTKETYTKNEKQETDSNLQLETNENEDIQKNTKKEINLKEGISPNTGKHVNKKRENYVKNTKKKTMKKINKNTKRKTTKNTKKKSNGNVKGAINKNSRKKINGNGRGALNRNSRKKTGKNSKRKSVKNIKRPKSKKFQKNAKNPFDLYSLSS